MARGVILVASVVSRFHVVGAEPGRGCRPGLVLTSVLRDHRIFTFELIPKRMTGVRALVANAAFFAALSVAFPARWRPEPDGPIREGLTTTL